MSMSNAETISRSMSRKPPLRARFWGPVDQIKGGVSRRSLSQVGWTSSDDEIGVCSPILARNPLFTPPPEMPYIPPFLPARLRRAFFVQFRLGIRAIPPNFFRRAFLFNFALVYLSRTVFYLPIGLRKLSFHPPPGHRKPPFHPPPRPPVGRGRVKSLF